jgi:hypothetical protein
MECDPFLGLAVVGTRPAQRRQGASIHLVAVKVGPVTPFGTPGAYGSDGWRR